MSNIRIGKISSIDYSNAMARVVYSDKDNAVTANLPMLSNGEYHMPEIGQSVIVLHMTNGSSRGVILGSLWNKANVPAEGRKGVYRKELSKTQGKAIIKYDDSIGKLTLRAPIVELGDGATQITLNEIISRIEAIERREQVDNGTDR